MLQNAKMVSRIFCNETRKKSPDSQYHEHIASSGLAQKIC